MDKFIKEKTITTDHKKGEFIVKDAAISDEHDLEIGFADYMEAGKSDDHGTDKEQAQLQPGLQIAGFRGAFRR